jgi:hypothetical protein
MDYQKVDGRLATEYDAAPTDASKRFAVFVRTRTPLSEDALRELERMQVSRPKPTDSILTMELSTLEVSALSDRSWVISIRSSHQLRPLEE